MRYSRQEDIEAVRPLVDSDRTTAEIAEKLGITPKRVQAALRTLGAPKHRSSAIARKRARLAHYRETLPPLLAQGLTATQIADKLGLQLETVTGAMRDLGIDPAARGRTLRKDRADHGDPAMWMKCDCQTCTTAKRAYRQDQWERAKERFDPATAEHGTGRTASLGCPCELCREYRVTQGQERQTRTRSTAGEHYQPWDGEQVSLVASGRYTISELARMLGRTYAAVSNIRAALADPEHPSHARYQALLDDYRDNKK